MVAPAKDDRNIGLNVVAMVLQVQNAAQLRG